MLAKKEALSSAGKTKAARRKLARKRPRISRAIEFRAAPLRRKLTRKRPPASIAALREIA